MNEGRAASLTRELSNLLAERRTHGEVFMDGRHNPLPTEITAARRFIEEVERVLAMSDAEFVAMETAMGYPPSRTCPTCNQPITKEAHGGEHPSAGSHDPALHALNAYAKETDATDTPAAGGPSIDAS